MELECTKLGNNKSISLNSKYNLINESDKRYTLVNDKGVLSNYAKNLFIAIPEELIATTIIEINELNVETSCDNELIFKINCPFTEGLNFNFTSQRNFTFGQTAFSCGITGLNGLDNLQLDIFRVKRIFGEFLTNNNQIFILNPGIDIDELFKDITKSLIQDIIANFQGEEGNRSGLLIMSTNTNLSNLLKNALEELSTTSTTVHNPNSKNNITMWSFVVNEEISQEELDNLNNDEEEVNDWAPEEDED